MNLLDVFSIVSLLLAVTALYLAVKALKESREDTKITQTEIKESTEAIKTSTERINTILLESRDSAERIQNAIAESSESVKTTLFDDVTRGIFEHLKANQRLADRLTVVSVDEKKELGILLADPDQTIREDPQAPDMSLLEYLIRETLKREKTTMFPQTQRSLFIESGPLCL